MSDPDKRLQALWLVCDQLPKNNKNNLRFVQSLENQLVCYFKLFLDPCTFYFPYRYLVKFLARLAQESDVNKMTPSNIAIVLGPNLLWAKTEG